jgi:hypothetical protein
MPDIIAYVINFALGVPSDMPFATTCLVGATDADAVIRKSHQ